MSTQDSFRTLCDAASALTPSEPGAAADLDLLRQAAQLSAFSDAVQELYRLSTTAYDGLQAMFAAHLESGRRILGLNCAAITQLDSAGLVTRCSCGLPEGFDDGRAVRVLEAGETLLSHNGAGCYIGTPVHTSGRIFGVLGFWTSDSVATLPERAAELVEMMARGIGSAIRHRELTDTLNGLACQDSLTGLSNRLQIVKSLDEALEEARANNLRVALIFIDLDRFKRINDMWGHAQGDSILQQVAVRLRDAAGPDCMVGRFGGDEFVALLRNISSRQSAVETAYRMLQATRLPIDANGAEVRVGASAGISVFPDDASDAASLLQNADKAMYDAKRAGCHVVLCLAAER